MIGKSALLATTVLITADQAGAQNTPAAKPEATIKSARYISAEEIPAYLASIKSLLSMNNRPYDPFGQTQDPAAKPLMTKNTSTPRRFVPPKPTSFTEIIRKIQVNTIMPGENRFLIGTRSFKKGDRIPLDFRGRVTQVEVTGVDASKIEFQNVETGEVATVELNLLPPGVTAGADGVQVPGMVVETKDAPLVIESNNP